MHLQNFTCKSNFYKLRTKRSRSKQSQRIRLRLRCLEFCSIQNSHQSQILLPQPLQLVKNFIRQIQRSLRRPRRPRRPPATPAATTTRSQWFCLGLGPGLGLGLWPLLGLLPPLGFWPGHRPWFWRPFRWGSGRAGFRGKAIHV